mmetsp:Transcript_23396/g.61229  ORF Transcript_23396/g.61229 Transcript_23396/m.61229 type:complete len:210 (-) Transcript_23396:734-1363(-)
MALMATRSFRGIWSGASGPSTTSRTLSIGRSGLPARAFASRTAPSKAAHRHSQMASAASLTPFSHMKTWHVLVLRRSSTSMNAKSSSFLPTTSVEYETALMMTFVTTSREPSSITRMPSVEITSSVGAFTTTVVKSSASAAAPAAGSAPAPSAEVAEPARDSDVREVRETVDARRPLARDATLITSLRRWIASRTTASPWMSATSTLPM